MHKTVRRRAADSPPLLPWRSWAFIAFGVFVAVLAANGASRPLLAGIRNAREVVHKTRQYQYMVAVNRASAEELEFLKTVEGKKQAAREELGYMDRHEQLLEPVEDVALDGDLRVGARLRTRLDEAGLRARYWARDAADITKCMLGMWEPVMPENGTASAP